MIYAFGATSTPPIGGAVSYNYESMGGNSGKPPTNGIVKDQPRPPDRVVKNGRTGDFVPVLFRRCGVWQFGTTKWRALKAVYVKRDGPGVFTQDSQVNIYLGHTGARGGR